MCILTHAVVPSLSPHSWHKLLKSFHNEKKDRFDISKVPDIYDSAKYDAIHNGHLGLDVLEVRAAGRRAAAASPLGRGGCGAGRTCAALQGQQRLCTHMDNPAAICSMDVHTPPTVANSTQPFFFPNGTHSFRPCCTTRPTPPAQELYVVAKLLADVVIPCEYGLDSGGKLRIGSKVGLWGCGSGNRFLLLARHARQHE